MYILMVILMSTSSWATTLSADFVEFGSKETCLVAKARVVKGLVRARINHIVTCEEK